MFTKIIATREADVLRDRSLKTLLDDNRRVIDVATGTSLKQAIAQVQASDFVPDGLPCTYSARLPLAQYNPDTVSIEFSDRAHALPDELHRRDECLLLRCRVGSAGSSGSFSDRVEALDLPPPADLLHRLVAAGLCEDFERFCDTQNNGRISFGSTSFPNLIKAAQRESNLRLKKGMGAELDVQGLENGLSVSLSKHARNTQVVARIAGLPKNCFGLTQLSFLNLCGDAMIVMGHDYGSEQHRRHNTLPRMANASDFAKTAEVYIDLARKMYDVFLEFPDTPEPPLWRKFNDSQKAARLARLQGFIQQS